MRDAGIPRQQFNEHSPYRKTARKLPSVISREGVTRLLNFGSSPFERTLPMVLSTCTIGARTVAKSRGSIVNGQTAKADAIGTRPKAVTISTWLMAVLNILGYAIMWEPEAHETRLTVFFFIVVFTLTIAAGYVVLWFFWKGKNWARILVLLNCFVCFYNVRDIHFFLRVNPVEKVTLVSEAVLAIFLLYWLNTREAKVYFKRNKFRRRFTGVG
jgi:hypothetical protein